MKRMTNKEAINWLISLTADIGKSEHHDLWHYEQALYEIKEMLEGNDTNVLSTDTISRQAAIDATWFEPSYTDPLNVLTEVRDRLKALPSAQPEQRWIPCSERMPEEYGEYRITWVTSYAPSKRFIGDSEYEVTSVWDEERKDFKGEWLLDEYIKHYPDVKVIAWKPLEEPYQAERRTDE